MNTGASRGRLVAAELFRLAVVVALTAAGFTVASPVANLTANSDQETVRLVLSLLGALLGYVFGGVIGRSMLRRVDRAQEQLASVDSPVLIAGVLGAIAAALLGGLLMLPLILLPGRTVTLPIGTALLVLLVYAGMRVGGARGGDLSRFVGVRGAVAVRTPARGAGTKIVDTSALIDARIVEVARCGFLEGTLVIPEFVLEEIQAFADAEDPHKRSLGRRGLDALRTLREEGLVTVEFTSENPPDAATVDGKLAALCRQRSAALLTNDANLAEVAEAGGVRALNVNGLAESVRPPAVPGDRVEVRIIKSGTEAGQGVGYLEDGTMVVVERAASALGTTIVADVTSIVTNRRGRMLFATRPGEG